MAGKLVILSGPSGVGKDTVLDAWTQADPKVKRVVAYTTRPMRTGERDGHDYNFRSVDQFEELIEKGAFLEYKLVFGNYYGTPLHDMEHMLSKGLIAVLKIDVQGALVAMKLRPDAITIFIMPPSMEELDRRIRARATETAEVIEKRLKTAHEEIELSRHYKYLVVNQDVPTLVAELQEITA